MKHTSFRKLGPGVAVGRIAIALATARETDTSIKIPAAFTEAAPALIRQVPSWVARAALVKSHRAWWLWCEPRRVRAHDGQCVLDIPDGRYIVETLDTRSHAWVSCESAAGSPLVIGLPYTGRPVLACVRRVSRVVQIPRE
jgi:hypothetical protein